MLTNAFTLVAVDAVGRKLGEKVVLATSDGHAGGYNCENTCLISSAGSVEWLCVPRRDSPSVFGAILDRGAGHFRMSPYGVSVCRTIRTSLTADLPCVYPPPEAWTCRGSAARAFKVMWAVRFSGTRGG